MSDSSNHAKYTQGTRNPVVQYLMRRLFDAVRGCLSPLGAKHLLDAGCGEGHALTWLADALPPRVTGFDQNPQAVAWCQSLHPAGDFSVQTIYELPYAKDAFDVVLCMEVLEHLKHPARALAELARVSSSHLIITVPNEPWFQLGNFARGKYLSSWGNHPEHIQHWGVRSFPKFLQDRGLLHQVQVQAAGPWLVASAQVHP